MENKVHIRPMLMKLGAAVALSLGGILYACLKANNMKPFKSSPPSSQPHLDTGDQKGNSSSGQEKSPLSKSPRKSCPSNHCSSRPTLNEEENKCREKDGNIYELEIRNLRNMVKNLKERERDLEIQLLEYYGLKEQEKAVMELQNRLKINNVEGKLFKLKIESLEADKRRLEEQVGDHAKVSAAFEDAKSKIKSLKKKLRAEAEQNREQILGLQERMTKFQEMEEEDAAAKQAEIQTKLQQIKDLEKEAKDLKNSNNILRLENSEMSQKLEYVQCIATTVLHDDEKTFLKEECHRLKQEKKILSKEIERLKSEHAGDVEELVHLRWLNSCFRYELRYRRNGSREQVGEEKGNSDQQNSFVTDSGEDSCSVHFSPGNQTQVLNKTKVISKFMRLIRGKKRNNDYGIRRSGDTSAYIEDMMGGFPSYSPVRHSGSSTEIEVAADDIYNGSRSSSQGSRLSSVSYA